MAETWRGIQLGDGDEYDLSAADHRIETCEQAVRWRFDQLVLHGFTVDEADAVSTNADVDLHRILELAGRGCPTDVACRIEGVDVKYRDPVELLAA